MKIILLTLVLLITTDLLSQETPVEILFGHHHYRYQHAFSKSFKTTRFGFSHVSSILAEYKDVPAEVMAQSYITYRLAEGIHAGAGTFYSSVPGFNPSINIQFSKFRKNYIIFIVPRMDLKEYPSYEIMFFTEYFPKLTEKLNLYARLQVMENFSGSHHNRSYQLLRLGFQKNSVRFGLGFDLNAYGPKIKYTRNVGIFTKVHF